MVSKDEKFSEKCEKETKTDGNVYYMSDLVNAIPRKDIIQRLIKKRKASEKLDMVDIKHRNKLTETEVSRILGERKTLRPDMFFKCISKLEGNYKRKCTGI